MTDIGDIGVGDTLELALFDDVTISLTMAEKMPTSFGGEAFLAAAQDGTGAKSAVVLRSAAGLTVDVQDYLKGKVYRVVASDSNVLVEECVSKEDCSCENDVIDVSTRRSSKAVSESATALADNQSATTSNQKAANADIVVDILVAYDRNASLWVASNGGGTTNFAQIAVQKMNAALANTGLDKSFRFRLVGVTTVGVSANNVRDALYAITDGDPEWNDIRNVREQVGADIVTLLIDKTSGSAGLAWALASWSSISSFGDLAYNVCSVRHVARSHTMTHECGHNLGAGHSTLQSSSPGPQRHSYSAGYYFTGKDGKKYCTIMAAPSEGPTGTRIPYFSSPDYSYSGKAVGDSTHDNTRTLAKICAYAAQWRDQKVPSSFLFPVDGKSYEVKFNANGGTLPKGKKMAAQTLAYDAVAKLTKNAFKAPNGCVFAGWATSKANAKKGVVAYKDAATVGSLTADGGTVTLYAVWAKKTYKVAFYANGGTGRMAVESFTYGKAKKLSANKFKAPKGKKFVGWAKSKSAAKKGKVTYRNKQKVKNLLITGKTVKLYAVWKKK